MWKITLVSVAMLLLFSGTVTAKKNTYEVARTAKIVAPRDGGYRALVAFDIDIGDFERRWIRSAFLEFDVAGEGQKVSVAIAEISTYWASATWTSPWRAPGGDWIQDEELLLEIDGRRTGKARVNVTEAVRSALDEGRTPAGFMFLPGKNEGREGFDARQLTGVSFETARLVVDHMKPRLK